MCENYVKCGVLHWSHFWSAAVVKQGSSCKQNNAELTYLRFIVQICLRILYLE